MNLERILSEIRPVSEEWRNRAREHTAHLIMPPRALGRLHEVAERLCAIQRTLTPQVSHKGLFVMAGDHGVVEEGVSAYPQVVTGEMVRAFLRGGATINALARAVGAQVWVVDLGIVPALEPATLPGGAGFVVKKVAAGTGNIAKGPAMSREQAERAVVFGFEVVAERIRSESLELVGMGDMGIGNTTPSAAIAAALTGRSVEELVGMGTGVDAAGLSRKQRAVRRALELNRPDPQDALDVLSKVGGFEIGGIAGGFLAAACHGVPAMLDGFISTAGALIAQGLCPSVTQYLFAAHGSAEGGHRFMLEKLGEEPLLSLDMRLGEGTGAALAMSLVDAAARVMREVLTFEQAGVTEG